ncbi:MAG: glycosyltransferase family 4 protein [Bacteroidetes bacterium]|nr:glycosyltransferase family 4 protein [Bacteroidota bacterium]
MQRKKILFTSTLASTFILEDLKLLQKRYDVTHLRVTGVFAPFRILAAVPSSDVTYTWFATVYAFFVVFFARLFGKKSIVIIGGADASKMPEIRYGIWRSPWKVPLLKWTMRHAYQLLVVDPFLKTEIIRLARYGGENVSYVPTGYDPDRWKPAGEKEPFVLTVAGCHDRWRMRKKGLDILFEAARMIPDTEFAVVGMRSGLIDEVRESVPSNVELIPFLNQDALLPYYQRAKVYCQPSYTEGLPNSLCEAMLCGCVPVGSLAGGIPTAIGECGYLVPYGDAGQLAGALRQALLAPAEAGIRARQFVARTFTMERRENALQGVIEEATR